MEVNNKPKHMRERVVLAGFLIFFLGLLLVVSNAFTTSDSGILALGIELQLFALLLLVLGQRKPSETH
jgi:uncharacterized membrane protein